MFRAGPQAGKLNRRKVHAKDEAPTTTGSKDSKKRRPKTNPATIHEPSGNGTPRLGLISSPLFYQTNHLNLASILSCGYLKPIGGFRKYYSDLLELAPGWIPLTTEPQLLGTDHVTSESPSLPIYIELTTDPNTSATLIGDGDASVFVTDLPISISKISTIHLRSDRERDEILARDYSGIDFSAFALKVSPQLFTAGSTPAAAEAFISNLPKPTKELAFELIDKRAGAIVAVFATGNSLEIRPTDLRALLGIPEDNPSQTDALINFSTFIAVDPTNTDYVLLAASIAELSMVDRFSNWDPSTILKSISTRFATMAPDPEPTLELLRNVFRVINLKRPFGDVGPGPGNLTANALQWVLTNPEMDALLDPPPFIKSASQAQFFAAIMSGFLTGFELSSPHLRTADVCCFLWDWQASALKSAQNISVNAAIRSDESTWTVLHNDKTIASGLSAPISLPTQEDSAEPVYTAAQVETNGWFECLKYSIAAAVDEVAISIRDGRISIMIPGPVVVEKQIDFERLAERLGKSTETAKTIAPENKVKPRVPKPRSKNAKLS
jgi:hypothetical protein